MAKLAIVAGYAIRYPVGGNVVSVLHYLAGLRRLGFEVVFVEEFGWQDSCYHPSDSRVDNDPAEGIGEVCRHFERFGIQDWHFVAADGQTQGLTREAFSAACRQADLLLGLGPTTWLEEFRNCRCRAYLDTDPGFSQFSLNERSKSSRPGFASPFDFHHHFTLGERIGARDCPVPTFGLHWIPTRPPVVLDWLPPVVQAPTGGYSTVMNWNSYNTPTYQGERYGQKDIEMRKILDVPARTRAAFDVVLAGPPDIAELLGSKGWRVSPSASVQTVEAYLDFIGRSRGEFSVAKNGYVKARCGWFSERTANYLALGRPAIVQDTGFSEKIPTGLGLLKFSSPDEAVQAIETVERDYPRHATAARRIAEEHFNSDQVLGQMLEAVQAHD